MENVNETVPGRVSGGIPLTFLNVLIVSVQKEC